MFLEMDSYEPACNELKHAYDGCFKQWLREEYLPLTNVPNSRQAILKKFPPGYEPCKELFDPYNKCIMEALERDNIDLKKVRQNLIHKPLEEGLKD